MKRVGFFLRASATLIDAVICLFILLAVAWTFMSIFDPTAFTESRSDLLTAAVLLAYTSTEIFLAATPGKLLLGLSIANSNGTRAPRSVLSLRWSTKYFWLICLLLFGLSGFVLLRLVAGFSSLVLSFGCLFASTDDHLAWHDKWCHTAVFRRRDLPNAPPVPVPPSFPAPL